MREIKFRYWFRPKAEMFEDTYFNEFTEVNEQFADIWDDHIVMQYTGLKDKNGVEIYEGDVVILYNWDEDCWDVLRTVEFSEGSFMVTDIDKSGTCSIQMVELSECGIIGNIYENGELLND